MADTGTAGGKAPAETKQPVEGAIPTVGFCSAPNFDEDMLFEPTHGFGGGNPGAH